MKRGTTRRGEEPPPGRRPEGGNGQGPGQAEGESVRSRAERRLVVPPDGAQARPAGAGPGVGAARPGPDDAPPERPGGRVPSPATGTVEESVRERAARRTITAGTAAPAPAERQETPASGGGGDRSGAARAPARVVAEPDGSRLARARERENRRRYAGILLALLLLVAALSAGAYALGRQAGREPVTEVQVPVVRGEDLSTANNLLQELGLRTVFAPAVFDDQIPRNAVISTNPPAGSTLPSDGVVTVTYSNGPEPVRIPLLTGQPEETAREVLEQAGLTPGLRVEEPSGQVASGAVVRVEPIVGSEVPPGTTVTLVVSSGPPPVVLPRVIGLPEDEAASQLAEAGLEVEIQRQASRSAPGTVVDQNPVPGTVAGPGTLVVLVVSRG